MAGSPKPVICRVLASGVETAYNSAREGSEATGILYKRVLASASYGCITSGTVWRWADGTPHKAQKTSEQRAQCAKARRERYALEHGISTVTGGRERQFPAGRVLSAFEGLLGEGWRGCAQELLDGFRAPLNVLLLHVANWYTSQHKVEMPSDEVARITEELKKEYGDG